MSFKIVQSKTTNEIKSNNLRRPVAAGTMLYYVQDTISGKYFVWCYLNKIAAEIARTNLVKTPMDKIRNLLDYNFKTMKEDCRVTDPKVPEPAE